MIPIDYSNKCLVRTADGRKMRMPTNISFFCFENTHIKHLKKEDWEEYKYLREFFDDDFKMKTPKGKEYYSYLLMAIDWMKNQVYSKPLRRKLND